MWDTGVLTASLSLSRSQGSQTQPFSRTCWTLPGLGPAPKHREILPAVCQMLPLTGRPPPPPLPSFPGGWARGLPRALPPGSPPVALAPAPSARIQGQPPQLGASAAAREHGGPRGHAPCVPGSPGLPGGRAGLLPPPAVLPWPLWGGAGRRCGPRILSGPQTRPACRHRPSPGDPKAQGPKAQLKHIPLDGTAAPQMHPSRRAWPLPPPFVHQKRPREVPQALRAYCGVGEPWSLFGGFSWEAERT